MENARSSAPAPKGGVWWKTLLLPFYAAAVLTSAKSFRTNPVIGSSRLNRRGLHIARRRWAERMARIRRGSLVGLIGAEERASFERDGLVIRPDFLSPADYAAFRDEIVHVSAPAREAIIGDVLTRLIPLSVDVLDRLPTVKRVLEGSAFNDLLTYVGTFRRRPHLYIQTVFSRFCDGPPDVQSFFHSDTFHPTVKAWFYLDDVGDDDAPLAYVPGSHRATRRRLAWERRMSTHARDYSDHTSDGSFRFPDAEIARLGYPPENRLAVAANTLVVADTGGIHRRLPGAQPKVRIAIWAYSRSNPFLFWTGGDLAGLPIVRRHALNAYWAVTDWMKEKRKARRVWRWVGNRTPLEEPDFDAVMATHADRPV